jgi:integrase/recombinase XerD
MVWFWLLKPKQRKHTVVLYLLFLEDIQMGKAKTFTPTELRRVLDYIATRSHAKRNRAMILMTHYAGMRVGEVAALTWSDVMSQDGQVRDEIRLNADQTKGRHPRIVFVSPKLRKELETYVRSVKTRDADWSFFYTQKSLRRGFTANTLAQYFFNMYRKAGMDDASSHSGRRSFATSLASKGVGVRVLMRAMGHRNISTTIGYIEASDEMLRKAVELA